jgi:hypothetical protein
MPRAINPLILKYDTNGNAYWVGGYDNGGTEALNALALDGLGNAMVVGWSHDGTGVRDYVVVKYRP